MNCGILTGPGKLLDVPVYVNPAAVYKRSRSITFNPMNLMKVKFGNFRKRSLNAAIQERVLRTGRTTSYRLWSSARNSYVLQILFQGLLTRDFLKDENKKVYFY